MIVRDPITTEKQHFKMYKAKKQWVCASMTVATFAMAMSMYGTTNAHADATNTSSGTNTHSVANGGNAVSQTTASSNGQTIPVNVDHSQIEQAVKNANDAKIPVNDPTVVRETTNQNDLNSSISKINENESQQADNINKKVSDFKQQSEIKNEYNGVTNNHDDLDATVTKAQNTPGITVIKDENHVSVFDATKKNADKWNQDTKEDYDNQNQALKDAIAKQEQDYQAWKDNLANPTRTLDPQAVEQNLHLAAEPQAKVDVEFAGNDSEKDYVINRNGQGRGDYIDPNTLKDVHTHSGTVHLGVYTHNVPGHFATVTLSNLQHSYYVNPQTGQRVKIAKMVLNFSNLKINKNSAAFGYDALCNVEEFNVSSSDMESPEFYDEQGNLIQYVPGTAWLMVTSLSSGNPYTINGRQFGSWYESAAVSNGNQIYQVSTTQSHGGPAATYHDDGSIHADIGHSIYGDGDNGEAVIKLVPGGIITMGQHVNEPDSAEGFDITDPDSANKSNWYQWTVSSAMLPTNNPAPKTIVHYHYDEAKPKFTQGVLSPIDYTIHDLTTTVTPEKDWTENGQKTNDKVYYAGDTAAADVTVTVNNFDQYGGKDGVKEFVMDDDYSPSKDHVTISGGTITENGEDATDQYDLKVHDGHLTMTRKTLNGFTGGTITLHPIFTINKDFKGQLTNKGFVLINGLKYEVTPKNITSTTPDPHKDVGSGVVEGKIIDTINGKTVANGSTETFTFTTADLPANRAKKITSRVFRDNLDPHLEYKSYKVYLMIDGKLTDVTSHVKLDQNGQQLSFTEDQYLMDHYNQDLASGKATPIYDVTAVVHGDNVKIKNTYTLIQNGISSDSNEVGIDTPEPAKPTKTETNEQGANIDGKQMLPGSTGLFTVHADYDQYKNIVADPSSIKDGFYIFDDYPDEALLPNVSAAIIKDSKGNVVNGMTVIYQSVAQAPEVVQKAVAKSGLKIVGAFTCTYAKDMSSYFTKYVQAGDDVSVTIPMTLKEGFTGSYENKAYQVDFGNGYSTNITHNTVPKLDPKKDIVATVDSDNSLNGKTIKVGQVFDYKLEGDVLTNLGDGVHEYGFHDDYDQAHDQSTSQVVVVLKTDVKMKDGSILKKGTNVTDKCTIEHDTVNGKIDIEFKKSFLDQVDPSGSFGADAYLQMKRIKSGHVLNKWIETLNGHKVTSNTVTSDTPEPPAKPTPKTPTPEAPKPATPATPTPQKIAAVATPAPAPQKQAKLPQTGNDRSGLAAGFMGFLIALGSLGFGFKKKHAA